MTQHTVIHKLLNGLDRINATIIFNNCDNNAFQFSELMMMFETLKHVLKTEKRCCVFKHKLLKELNELL